jgi:hypothetical protein
MFSTRTILGGGGHLARASSSNGCQAQRMSKFQEILLMRSSSSKGHNLWILKLDCKQEELLQVVIELGLSGVIPNITIILHISVSLSATVASGEYTFNMLKHVKNYCRSTMRQDFLNGFATRNLNCDLVQKLDFLIINSFSRKGLLEVS